MAEEQRGKLDAATVQSVTDRLNKIINVPLVPEWAEGLGIKAAVIGVDYFLLRYLGEEVYDIIFDLNKGVTDEVELEALVIRLARLANKKMDIPLLNEEQEAKFFYNAIQMIVAALSKGKDINTLEETAGPDLTPNHGSVGG